MDKSIEDMSPSEALRYMRGLYGMKRSEFCEHFGIPLRSLQHWEIGDRKPAPFVIGLMRKCFELERENERLRDCIDTLDRQNDELKALLKGEGVVQ